jgi:hypothetical protein
VPPAFGGVALFARGTNAPNELGMLLTHELLLSSSGQLIYLGAADGAAFFFVSEGIGGTSSSTLHCST